MPQEQQTLLLMPKNLLSIRYLPLASAVTTRPLLRGSRAAHRLLGCPTLSPTRHRVDVSHIHHLARSTLLLLRRNSLLHRLTARGHLGLSLHGLLLLLILRRWSPWHLALLSSLLLRCCPLCLRVFRLHANVHR